MTDYGRDVRFGVFITPSTDLLNNSYALADLADECLDFIGDHDVDRLRRGCSGGWVLDVSVTTEIGELTINADGLRIARRLESLGSLGAILLGQLTLAFLVDR